MSKSIALVANIQILKPLSNVLVDKGYVITHQFPVLTQPIINQLVDAPSDIIFISEEVQCDDELNIIDAVSYIKARSNPRFIIQTKPRRMGDSLLSDLVSLVVYDFLPKNEYEIPELIDLIEHPREYLQVKDYHILTRRILDFPLEEIQGIDSEENIDESAQVVQEVKPSWKENLSNKFRSLQEKTHKSIKTTTKQKSNIAEEEENESSGNELEVYPLGYQQESHEGVLKKFQNLIFNNPKNENTASNVQKTDYAPYGGNPSNQAHKEVPNKIKDDSNWVPIRDIENSYVYSKDDSIATVVKISPGRPNREALESILIQMSEHFQIFCMDKPLNLNQYIMGLQQKLTTETDNVRKKILSIRIQQATQFVLSAESTDRYFYLIIKCKDGETEKDLTFRVNNLRKKLLQAKIKTEICKDREIYDLYSQYVRTSHC